MSVKVFIKTFVKVFLFLAITAILVAYIGRFYVPWDHEESSQSSYFYKQKKNSIDLIMVGSSNVRNGISSCELWKNYGIVAYTRGNSRQAPEQTKFNVIEAFKTQSPKMVVMGITRLFSGYDYSEDEPFLRKSMDYKKFSLLKMGTALEYVNHDKEQSLLSYAFPLLRYHSRWNTITFDDVKKAIELEDDFRRGQYRVNRIDKQEDFSLYDTDPKPAEYDRNAWKNYSETIQYLKDRNVQVMVVVMPDHRWTYGMHKTARELVESTGVEFFDFNEDAIFDATGIDWSTDFYDYHHLNLGGCRKSSKFFGDYITKNYKIPQWKCDDDVKRVLDLNLKEYEEDYKGFLKKVDYKG